MATCLAMFTNISASVIFISRVEMYFHDRYKAYSEAVIGGRGADIAITKKRMFRTLSEELMSLARVQFIITLVIFLICMIFLPQLGLGGMTLRIYPCLAAGYFILFLMYAEIIFMYYFNDMKGCVLTGLCILPDHDGRKYDFHTFFGDLVWCRTCCRKLRRMDRSLYETSVDGKTSGFSHILQRTSAEKEKRRLPIAKSI